MDFWSILNSDEPLIDDDSDPSSSSAPAASSPAPFPPPTASSALLRAALQRVCFQLEQQQGPTAFDVRQRLDEQGYLIIDDAFPPSLAHLFHAELTSLYTSGLLSLNATAYVTQHQEGEKPIIQQLVAKPGIFETELTPSIRSSSLHHSLMPHLFSLYAALPVLEHKLAQLFPTLGIVERETKELTSVKVQYNTGSAACFPFHIDSAGGLKDSRRLTFLLYLNPEWKEGEKMGGELVLQPFLKGLVKIQPKFNRVAIFKSAEMLHRVMPSYAPSRTCLTIWLHGIGDGTAGGNQTAAESTQQQQQQQQLVSTEESTTASAPPSSMSSSTIVSPSPSSSSLSSPCPSPSPFPSPSPSSSPGPECYGAEISATSDSSCSSSSSFSSSSFSSPSPSPVSLSSSSDVAVSAVSSSASPSPAAHTSAPIDFAALWMRRLHLPVWQTVLSKICYGNQWAESYYEAHGGGGKQSTTGKKEQEQQEGEEGKGKKQPLQQQHQDVIPLSAPSTLAQASSLSPIGGELLVTSLLQDRERLIKEIEQEAPGMVEFLQNTAEEASKSTITI